MSIKQILRDYENSQKKRKQGSNETTSVETIVAKKKKKAIVLRELQQTVECANKLSTLFYSIFLLPTNTGITQKLMMQGKQNAQAIKLHPHSIGVSPLFAFGMLLLLAADMLNNKPEIKKSDKQNM